jgi:hypothetical protein
MFNSTVLLSLLFCVAGIVFWIRSHVSPETYQTSIGKRLTVYSATSDQGQWTLKRIVRIPKPPRDETDLALVHDMGEFYGVRRLISSADVAHERRWLGFGYLHLTDADDPEFLNSAFPYVVSFTFLNLPYWFLVGVTVILPALSLRSAIRRSRGRRRIKSGMCQYCGYDLRASPGRCPECGSEVAEISSIVRRQTPGSLGRSV